MASHCSFRIGGSADALVRPKDAEAAALLLSAASEAGVPVFVLGAGANILVGDRGIRGIVLDAGGLSAAGFERDARGRALLVAGAGLSIDELCLEALCRGLGGLEDFAGMPGTVGGSVFMNARCYEREMSQVLAWVESVDAGGAVERRGLDPSQWSYKRSPYQAGGAQGGDLVVAAAFALEPADPSALATTMRSRRADREAKGHYRLPSAGSVFKNNHAFGKPSGKILDELGFRGRRIGGAAVSDWHANIFVNAGGATAKDMRSLIDLARDEARARLGIELEPEVLMVGEF